MQSYIAKTLDKLLLENKGQPGIYELDPVNEEFEQSDASHMSRSKKRTMDAAMI